MPAKRKPRQFQQDPKNFGPQELLANYFTSRLKEPNSVKQVGDAIWDGALSGNAAFAKLFMQYMAGRPEDFQQGVEDQVLVEISPHFDKLDMEKCPHCGKLLKHQPDGPAEADAFKTEEAGEVAVGTA